MVESAANAEGNQQSSPHEWIHIVAGRVCQKCRAVQLKGEFRDENDCGQSNDPRDDGRRPGR